MTIDERLEKLAERHESLAQAVELMVMENRERDARLAERDTKIGDLIIQVVESVQKLAIVAGSHERRITHLEGGAQA
jgi:hypothetical protein